MTRFHELDALRCCAMLLGVVLHASLYLVWEGWPVVAKEVSPDLPYDDIVHLIHGFRMPLFFMLSGFFTALLWQRNGVNALVRHRLKRVGLPLLIGMFTIVPISVLWILWLGEEDFDVWSVIFSFTLGWIYGLQHLWFLWMLLLLVGLFAGIVALGMKFTDRRVWWVLIPLVLLPQLMMTEVNWGPDTASHLVVNPVVLVYYLFYFLFGAFMFQTKMSLKGLWAIMLLPAVLVYYLGRHFEFVSDASWAHLASSVLQVVYAWGMCFGAMGLFKMIASVNRFWIRYLSDASYWIYLWHLALIYPAQHMATNLSLNVHLETVAIVVSTTGILLLIYHFAVRYTWIGTMLNGPRFRDTERKSAGEDGNTPSPDSDISSQASVLRR